MLYIGYLIILDGQNIKKISFGNSIALGSAPRREADSQPLDQLAKPAVNQTETHSLGFLSVADPAPSSGEDCCYQGKQWPNGNATDRRIFGRWFEPWSGEDGGGATGDSRPTKIRTTDLSSAVGCITI